MLASGIEVKGSTTERRCLRNRFSSLLLSPSFLFISYAAIDSFVSFAKIALFAVQVGPGGGIGRRTWFRSMRRKVWRFESSLGHQRVVAVDTKQSEKPSKAFSLLGFLFF
jgi:hypothetical protein